MRVKLMKDGFITILENDYVKEVYCKYGGPTIVQYHNGNVTTLNIACNSEHSQYGLPVSPDGKMLFVMDWYKGIVAYSIPEDSVVWKHKSTRIREIFTYDTYLIACRYGMGLLKVDLRTGQLLELLKSGTIDECFALVDPYVLVNYRGKISIIDTRTMGIVKQYPKNETNPFNPYNCMYQEIHRAELRGKQLIVYGYEKHPTRNFTGDRVVAGTKGLDFERAVDFDIEALNP